MHFFMLVNQTISILCEVISLKCKKCKSAATNTNQNDDFAHYECLKMIRYSGSCSLLYTAARFRKKCVTYSFTDVLP